MNLKKIINESINIVLAENNQMWFSQLANYVPELRKYRGQIKRTDLSNIGDRDAENFVAHEFYRFIASLEQALTRCVQSQNINEALSDYGLRMPSTFANMMNKSRQYYYGTYNALNQMFGGGQGSRARYSQYTDKPPIESNGNQKLIELLTNIYPNIQRKYKTLNQGYVISQAVPAVENANSLIEKQIIPIVQNIQNAQGANP